MKDYDPNEWDSEDREVVSTLLQATGKYKGNKRMNELGTEMFRFYTELGYPPDYFLDKVKKTFFLDELGVVFVVSKYQQAFLDHRRKSGVQEKNIDKIRRKNREDMKRLVKTGELGVY